ncbi:MAG: hypothetical protein KF779_00655 [Hyphomonadaceae bacterium]|nr:hypothetical protein [Hyphomonadaceae bacterium]MCA8885001.1 hypothetical protein [Hyphomonadaceae bacterium]
MTNRILGIVLIIGAAFTALYWWSYFTAGDVMVSHERWYTAFEDAFPFADGWMALCMTGAGIGILGSRSWAPSLGLLAGSALIFLTAMDATFNIQNDLYPLAATNDAMKAEIAINIATALLGAWTIAACWPRRSAD